MKKLYTFVLFMMIMILTGCAFPVGLAPTSTSFPTQTPVIWTVTPNPPTQTPEPTQTFTITPTWTQQVFIPITTIVTVDSLNLRKGPSSIFSLVTTIQKNSKLQVLGSARGGDWLLISTENNYSGWVAADFLFLDVDTLTIPVYDFTEGYLLRGRIRDQLENPIAGVNLAVSQGLPPNEIRTDVYSDAAGEFFAYLPLSAIGPWTIAIVGVKCTSSIMDSQCNYDGHFITEAYSIMIPEDVSMTLIYEYVP